MKIKNNQKINDVINEKLAQFVEEVARLYGVNIHIEDTDWQVIYDLKSELIKSMEGLGIEIID